jgi:hypothetical protein
MKGAVGKVYFHRVLGLCHEGEQCARFIFTVCWLSAMKGGSGQGLFLLGVGSLP